VFAGYDNWRLPSALDFTTGLPDAMWWSTDNEFGHLYGVELRDPANAGEEGPLWFWTGTVNPASSGEAFAFFWSWDELWLNDLMLISDAVHVTAVRDVVATPPRAVLLAVLGLGYSGWRLRRRTS